MIRKVVSQQKTPSLGNPVKVENEGEYATDQFTDATDVAIEAAATVEIEARRHRAASKSSTESICWLVVFDQSLATELSAYERSVLPTFFLHATWPAQL